MAAAVARVAGVAAWGVRSYSSAARSALARLAHESGAAFASTGWMFTHSGREASTSTAVAFALKSYSMRLSVIAAERLRALDDHGAALRRHLQRHTLSGAHLA